MTESEFNWEVALEFADKLVYKNTAVYLKDIEITVLQASWEGATYPQMADDYGYSAEYLNKDVGNKLWHKLSKVLQEKVTKNNFKAALRRVWEKQSDLRSIEYPELQVSPIITQLPFPESSVSPNSPFYIERNNIENLCYETILKPGSLIRIKAPKLMGKTSLINRIIACSTNKNYQTVYLDISSVERRIIANLDKLLRWLCCIVGRQLKLENQLNGYWDRGDCAKTGKLYAKELT